MTPTGVPAPFRDPSGHIYDLDGRIPTTITERAASDCEFVRQLRLPDRLVSRGWRIAATAVEPAAFGPGAAPVVRRLPRGVIEFVEKPDPTVPRMLHLREDVFDDDERGFSEALASVARIVHNDMVSAAGRGLYWYDGSRGSG